LFLKKSIRNKYPSLALHQNTTAKLSAGYLGEGVRPAGIGSSKKRRGTNIPLRVRHLPQMGKIVQITGLCPHLGEGSRFDGELFLEKSIRNNYYISLATRGQGVKEHGHGVINNAVLGKDIIAHMF
jgi:hypothetical protein